MFTIFLANIPVQFHTHPLGGPMKTRLIVFVVCLLLLVVAFSCTQQQRARNFGGTATENLPPGRKLVVATWKEDSLWFLTRPMRSDEQPETYEFKESSSFGMVQGAVIIQEHR